MDAFSTFNFLTMKNFISIFLFGVLFALSSWATPPADAFLDTEQFSDIGAPPKSHVFTNSIPGTSAENSHFIPGTSAESITDLDQQVQGSSAEVRQVNGLYVFLYSTPVGETEFLGAVVSPPIVLSTDMDKMVQLMSRRAHEKYPEAEAIIFSNNDLSKCDAVRFKQ